MSFFNYTDNNFVLVVANLLIKENILHIGVNIIDTNTNTVEIVEIIDNDFFTNLENILIQNAPAHENSKFYFLANVPREFYAQKFMSIINKIEVVDNKEILINNKEFNNRNVIDHLSVIKIFLTEDDFNNNSMLKKNELIFALYTLYSVLNYSRILQFSQFLNRFHLIKYNHNEFMSLDMTCIKCLNVFDNLDDKKSMYTQKYTKTPNENKSRNSVFSILNQCSTKFGSRMLKSWLLQPLQDLEEINIRLNIVEMFVSNFSYRTEIKSSFLNKIDDIQTINMTIAKYLSDKDENSVKMMDCVKLQNAINTTRSLLAYLKCYEGVNENILKTRYIDNIEKLLEKLVKLEEMIAKTVIFNNSTREYVINYELSKDLTEIQNNINEVFSEIDNVREDVEANIKTNKTKKVSIQEYASHGYVIELSKQDGENFIKQNKKYKLVNSNKKNIQINNTKLNELSDKMKKLKNQYKKIEKEYHKKVVEIVSTYYPLLEKLVYLLSELDVLSSFATIVHNSKEIYCKPIFKEQNERQIIIKESRHLILEWNEDIIRKNNPTNKNLISNTCQLEIGNNIKLITGINMGGKSTYLRQIGICVLLAHIGCYIPAEAMQLSIVDQIFTRVGAGDNMLKGISTYMNEMLEVCSLIKSATKNSLLLIDELGRGTSTDDGIGISYGILNYISQDIDCFCLFATHFFELTSCEEVMGNVKNYFVSYSVSDHGEILMDYKIIRGTSNNSLGINLFKSLKFDEDTCIALESFLN
jgi:DNA mismatch repair protein MSH2